MTENIFNKIKGLFSNKESKREKTKKEHDILVNAIEKPVVQEPKEIMVPNKDTALIKEDKDPTPEKQEIIYPQRKETEAKPKKNYKSIYQKYVRNLSDTKELSSSLYSLDEETEKPKKSKSRDFSISNIQKTEAKESRVEEPQHSEFLKPKKNKEESKPVEEEKEMCSENKKDLEKEPEESRDFSISNIQKSEEPQPEEPQPEEPQPEEPQPEEPQPEEPQPEEPQQPSVSKTQEENKEEPNHSEFLKPKENKEESKEITPKLKKFFNKDIPKNVGLNRFKNSSEGYEFLNKKNFSKPKNKPNYNKVDY